MNRFFEKHWDKLIGFFMSIIVAGLIGYFGARAGLVDRIEATEDDLLEKIDAKVGAAIEKIEKVEAIQNDNGRNIVRIVTSTKYIEDRQSEFAGTMRRLDAKLDKIDGDLDDISRDVVEIKAQND